MLCGSSAQALAHSATEMAAASELVLKFMLIKKCDPYPWFCCNKQQNNASALELALMLIELVLSRLVRASSAAAATAATAAARYARSVDAGARTGSG